MSKPAAFLCACQTISARHSITACRASCSESCFAASLRTASRIPGGLVDRHLLRDGEVHGKVQEGIGLAAFRRPLPLAVAFRVREHLVVLGVLHHDGERHRFERRESLARARLLPEPEEELAHLVAGRIEEAHFGSRVRFGGGGAAIFALSLNPQGA